VEGSSARLTLLTGGAGYLGGVVVDELLSAGRRVRVLDSLLHGQEDVAEQVESAGAELLRGDVGDPDIRRRALEGTEAVVHLAAIVGDVACARNPEVSQATNVDATRALASEALASGVGRFVFASTCSNYGRVTASTEPIAEDGELRPVSLYARQKVAVEAELRHPALSELGAIILRFATVYGVAPRMRFDLTVNEFTRDLWADRKLEVFGEQFWRPYVHVRDAARAVRAILEAPAEAVAGEVFNVGWSAENYRKMDIVDEIRSHLDTGQVVYVHRDADPRDYRVSFEKLRSSLGFETISTVPQGIAEVAAALSAGAFGDPFARRYRNTA
jgi:nucleoside-diphosphate-sugar epimerase